MNKFFGKIWRKVFYKVDKTKNSPGMPESFYVGQDYVEDSIRIPVEIQMYFSSPAFLDNAILNVDGKKIHLEQRGSVFRITFVENISEKLFKNILDEHKGDDWILGYISKVIPFINQEILKQRYRNAHFLVKTFTALDISQLWLVNKKTSEKVQVAWPKAITSFPPVADLATYYDNHLYFRDIIDAIHSYFNSNYEECVRKVITSVENFFKHNNLHRIKKESDSAFKDKVKQHIKIVCPMTDEDAAEVIIETYGIRTEIVHDGKRLSPSEGKDIGKRAIHLVLDVYKSYGTNEELKQYAFFLEMQFLQHEQFLGDLLTLERLERDEGNKGNIKK